MLMEIKNVLEKGFFLYKDINFFVSQKRFYNEKGIFIDVLKFKHARHIFSKPVLYGPTLSLIYSFQNLVNEFLILTDIRFIVFEPKKKVFQLTVLIFFSDYCLLVFEHGYVCYIAYAEFDSVNLFNDDFPMSIKSDIVGFLKLVNKERENLDVSRFYAFESDKEYIVKYNNNICFFKDEMDDFFDLSDRNNYL